MKIETRRGVMGRCGALVLAAAVVLGAWSGASAQFSIFRGADSRPAMTERDVSRYGGLLKLTPEQQEAAKDLVSGYTLEYEKLAKERREKMRDLSEEARESKDFSIMEQMGPMLEKFGKQADAMEESLISDLKSILSNEQTALWPKFERTRRREKTITRGTLAGESVDLVRIVDELELTPAVRAPLMETMEQYESDLDRVLVERNKVQDEEAAKSPMGKSGTIAIDVTSFAESQKKITEAGKKVRDVNKRYTPSIEGQLPEASRAAFIAAVKQSSFPQVYKPTRTDKALEAALKFEDLETAQRAAIEALSEQYRREAVTANDRWASAIVEEEEDGSTLGFGGIIIMNAGDEEKETPTQAARKARRELDKKTLDSLRAVLTETQREKLPAREEAPADQIIEHRGVTIQTQGRPVR